MSALIGSKQDLFALYVPPRQPAGTIYIRELFLKSIVPRKTKDSCIRKLDFTSANDTKRFHPMDEEEENPFCDPVKKQKIR